MFNSCSQQPDESIDAYTTVLRTPAETCQFGLFKDDLIRDRLVCGIRDNGQRKKLLQEPKLTLDSCRAAEATKLQVQDMLSKGKESSDVNALKSSRPKPNFWSNLQEVQERESRSKQVSSSWKE